MGAFGNRGNDKAIKNSNLGGIRARLALSTAIAALFMGGYGGRSAYAACVFSGGVYTCSGALDTTQVFFGAPLTVVTASGFGITTSTGNAFTLQGGETNYNAETVIFTDDNNSNISGAAIGIAAYVLGAGSLSITTTGTVTGNSLSGIYARNNKFPDVFTTSLTITATGAVTGGTTGIYARNVGTSLTVSAATVTGVTTGIDARNFGSEGLEITVTGDVTGENADGIYAFNSSNDTSGSMLITQTAGAMTFGKINGIVADNAGGSLTINALGTSVGFAGDGIHAVNRASASDLAVTAYEVLGNGRGIYARNFGDGALSVTTTGGGGR